MNKKTFDRFCDDKDIIGTTKVAFLDYLNRKYPEGIPDHVNLKAEWDEFYRESTGHVV